MTTTLDNLKVAFAGESQANRRYLAFAKRAEEEGYPHIARLFRAVAVAEEVHAINHLKAMGGLKSTAENLEIAIQGEEYEVNAMYPPMLGEAEHAGEKQAARAFRWALEVEKIHAVLYRQAAESLAQGKDIADVEYFICPVCGYTHVGPAEGKCPICGYPAEKFEKIV